MARAEGDVSVSQPFHSAAATAAGCRGAAAASRGGMQLRNGSSAGCDASKEPQHA